MNKVTPAKLETLRLGESLTDTGLGWGNGVIEFKRKQNGRIVATYRFSHDGVRHKVILGGYRDSDTKTGYTLSEIRENALKCAKQHEASTKWQPEDDLWFASGGQLELTSDNPEEINRLKAKAVDLGCPGNLRLAEYVESLERTLQNIMRDLAASTCQAAHTQNQEYS